MSTDGRSGAGALMAELNSIAGLILGLAFQNRPPTRDGPAQDQRPKSHDGQPPPKASLDLSTRGFMEAERVGEYFVILQVDNFRSHLLSVSGPENYKGYYDVSKLKFGIPIALVDDENKAVPITVTRLRAENDNATVRIQIWASPPDGLSNLSPYLRNPFK